MSALTSAATAGAAPVTLASRLSTGGLGPLKIGMTVSAAGEVVGSGFDPTQLSGESPADNACFWGGISPKRYELAVGNRKLLFYVSRAGKVSGMQAGRKPEIDYVEGCA